MAGLIALIANGASRLALFEWEWRAFGSKLYWWHGEGVWCWSYEDCDRILKSQQERKSAFGCVQACVPALFATNILIFLSDTGSSDSEWARIRHALHQLFLDPASESYQSRVEQLPKLIAGDWPSPALKDMNDKTRLQKLVSKCVFY